MGPNYYNYMFPNGTAGYGGGYGGGNSGASSGSNSGNNFSSFNLSNLMGPMGTFLGGAFGNAGAPYAAAGNSYNQYANEGANALQPYNQAGEGAIPNYENWAAKMQDPSDFINNLMNKYQQSPWAKFMQQQGVRQAQNAGSAEGMVGSSPYNLQVEQNAENISSQDLQNWLGKTLGINQQYGNAQQNLMNTGVQSANALSQLYQNEANMNAQTAYGNQAGQNQDSNDMFSGALGVLSAFL